MARFVATGMAPARLVSRTPHLVHGRLHEVGVERPRHRKPYGHARLKVRLGDLLHDVARLRRPGNRVVPVAQKVGDLRRVRQKKSTPAKEKESDTISYFTPSLGETREHAHIHTYTHTHTHTHFF